MGINLNLIDFKLLFDKIDFDSEGQIDYFKFCLLDYDKEQIRNRLLLQQRKPLLLKDKKEGHARFMDGRLPKNKDQQKFLEECGDYNRAKIYLDKKNKIKSNHE